MTQAIVNTQEWIIDENPTEAGEYMVTFLAEYELDGGKRFFRGLDIIEYTVDDGHRTEYNEDYGYWSDYIDWEAQGEGHWLTDDIENRFASPAKVTIRGWMPLPEVCEE